jgi:hypothetical protein
MENPLPSVSYHSLMALNRFVLMCVALLSVTFAQVAHSEDGYIARYQARVAATLANQPHWATPLITVAPRVEQGFRADFGRQTTSGGQHTWNLGNTKGLQLVPLPRLELRVSPPPFLTHSDPKLADGFGDVAFRVKYRLYGSNEEHHNAILTAILGASVPTGKSGNGSCCAILSPTLGMGKGYGKFTFISTIGGSLPVSNAARVGRQIVWNSTIHMHATRLLWVETEFNSTYFKGGRNDGQAQTFVTPGVLFSRIPVMHDASGKAVLSLTFGAGEQIALSHFSTYNHAPIFTARLRF